MLLVIDNVTDQILGQLLRERISRDGGYVIFEYLTATGVQSDTSLTAHVERV